MFVCPRGGEWIGRCCEQWVCGRVSERKVNVLCMDAHTFPLKRKYASYWNAFLFSEYIRLHTFRSMQHWQCFNHDNFERNKTNFTVRNHLMDTWEEYTPCGKSTHFWLTRKSFIMVVYENLVLFVLWTDNFDWIFKSFLIGNHFKTIFESVRNACSSYRLIQECLLNGPWKQSVE